MDWSSLPTELVGLVATCGRLSPEDVRNARSTCRAWRAALPPAMGGGPWLVLSRGTVAHGEQRVSFWVISPDEPGALESVQAWSPPSLTSCWGSSAGALALRSAQHGDHLFLHRPLGGEQERLQPLPHGGSPPKGIFISLLMWGVMRYAIFSPEARVYIERNAEEQNRWLEEPRFRHGARSVEFTGDLSTFVANDANEVRKDIFANYGAMDVARVDPHGMEPWRENGRHLFSWNDDVHLCIVGQSKANGQVVARVFAVVQGFRLEPRDSIGQNSLFLGQNRAILCPSEAGPVGRRANTIYIEDNSGDRRNPRILMIDVGAQQVVQTIPYPPHVAAAIGCYGPAGWISAWDMAWECRCEEEPKRQFGESILL